MSNDLTPEHIQRALDGDLAAQDLLVQQLTPEIHSNVAKMLRRWHTGTAAHRDLRQEVEDMTQEVFLELIEHDGRALRRWDAERLPLVAYVGYIARIRTAEVLRSKRGPWREDPRANEDLDRKDPRRTPEENASTSERLEKIYLCLITFFSPSDFHLFKLLFIHQFAPQEVVQKVGKSREAIYKWRSRLYERARKCLGKMSKKAS